MKTRKILLISLTVCIILIAIVIVLSYTHTLEKSTNQKNDNVAEKTDNSVDNSKKEDSDDKKEEENSSYEQTTENKTETESKTNNNEKESSQNKTSSSNSNNTNSSSTNNSKSNSSSSSNSTPTNTGESNSKPSSDSQKQEQTQKTQKQLDDEWWETFKRDPLTLMSVGALIDDEMYEDFEEQQREAKKWYNLGYRVEPARACTELSTGTKCVYGISVYIPGGTCGEVVGDILIDWHERKYITNVARAKEMGYECKGYEE